MVPGRYLDYWRSRKTYTAQLELLMVLVALYSEGETLRNKRGIWYSANVPILMALASVAHRTTKA